jgi:hypothetical protein
MWNAVPVANVADFTVTPAAYATVPTELAAYRESFTVTIENLAAKVFRNYGVKPNWMSGWTFLCWCF